MAKSNDRYMQCFIIDLCMSVCVCVLYCTGLGLLMCLNNLIKQTRYEQERTKGCIPQLQNIMTVLVCSRAKVVGV